jgi:hypothetical protein
MPERFAMVPLDVMESGAYQWLPHFAARVLFAFAAKFSGFNNGGLELTTRDAAVFGLNESELFAGIGLCMRARLVKRTVEARRRSGKGTPAKYALTWRTMGDFPALNLAPTAVPGHDWKWFKAPFARPRSVREALRALGYERSQPSRLHTLPSISKKVPRTRGVKTADMAPHALGEKEAFTGHAHGEEPGTRGVKKNRVTRLRVVSDGVTR